MTPPNLEDRCKKAILRMADDVSDINHKLTHFLEKYRDDFYKPQEAINYQGQY
jgi:hypothetical protein